MNLNSNSVNCSRKRFLTLAASFVIANSAFLFHDIFTSSTFADAEIDCVNFVDDLGRNVVIPSAVSKVIPTGAPAQTLMTTLLPDSLASLATDISEDKNDYEKADLKQIKELPETGILTAGSGSDLEIGSVIETDHCITLDVGIPKTKLKIQLDTLQCQSPISSVFIDLSFGNLPNVYRKLGKLFSCSERSEVLAQQAERALALSASQQEDLNQTLRIFYAPRKTGIELHESVVIQIDAIKHVGAQPITSPYDWENMTVNIESVIKENPDLIIFDDIEVLNSFAMRNGLAWEYWSNVGAIQNGNYLVSPALMHSWFGSLVFAQSIGLMWLSSMIQKNNCTYALLAEVRSFYKIFYNLSKSDKELIFLLDNLNTQDVIDTEEL